MILFACYGKSAAVVNNNKENDLDKVTLDHVCYSGYIASLKTSESHYDIGPALSSISFQFDSQTLVLIDFNIHDTQVIDSKGSVNADEVSVTGDYIEMVYTDPDSGKLRLKGTLKESTFTGKIYLSLNDTPATMNFITVLEKQVE